ncbi:MAG: hypothetical protein QMD92_02780 [bacterium]|nr:hypothetical protein [bacterium]
MEDSLIQLSELEDANPFGNNIPKIDWSEIISTRLGDTSWAMDVASMQRAVLSNPENSLEKREKAGETLRAIRGVHAIQDQTWLFAAKEVQKIEKYGATLEEGKYARELIEKMGELYFLQAIKLLSKKDFQEWLEKLKEPLREIEDHIKDRKKIIQAMEVFMEELIPTLRDSEPLQRGFDAFMKEIKETDTSSLSIPVIGLSILDDNILLYEEYKEKIKKTGKQEESKHKSRMRGIIEEASVIVKSKEAFGADISVSRVTQFYQYMLDFLKTKTIEDDPEFGKEIVGIIDAWENKIQKDLPKMHWPTLFKEKAKKIRA